MSILYSQFFETADVEAGAMVGAIVGEGGCSMELESPEKRSRYEGERRNERDEGM